MITSPRAPSFRFQESFASIVKLPAAWTWFMDEAVSAWVKSAYSPRESWKNKPFTKEDARFFSKGLRELSELFTEERAKKIHGYFTHPKYRSAYLLYFLPLQAAKFLVLYDVHAVALRAAVEHGRKTGALRIADLGAGPGTASIAALLKLLGPLEPLGLAGARELPFRIELDWFDLNAAVMADGQALVERLSSHFPRLRDRVTLRRHVVPWHSAAARLGDDTSLMLFGNILNEAAGPGLDFEHPQWEALWRGLLGKASGGGALFVEPAMRQSAQRLSRIRDQIFSMEIADKSPRSIWGPCLHAEACPLASGRDWCHFSVPLEVPGTWFREFSEGLGSERQWAKFSYLWLASRDFPAPDSDPKSRRVISDDLRSARSAEHGRKQKLAGPAEVLLCVPEAPDRALVQVSSGERGIFRGDLVRELAALPRGRLPRDGKKNPKR